jgi:hypothetical protein
VAEGWDNFEAWDVVLTDYYDRSNSVTVSYLKKAETTYFVCGNEQADVIVPFVGSHKFFYQARTNVFMEMSSKSVACPNAFTSDKVLLTVRVRTIDGAAKIGITEVGGQILSNDPVDYFKPKMLIEDDGGVKTLGDKITIKMPTIIDVLSPYAQANLTLTVRKPSKGYATSDDGITLQAGCPVDREYTVSLTEDGAYKVTFQYVDAGGNSITDGFTADVLDMEGPTIVLNDGYNESTVVTATLNTKVTLQGYTVSDNKSAADKLTVRCLVYSPSLEQLFVVNNQFEATRKGMYTVYYYAYDEAGNYSVASYRVYVG